MEWISVKDKLPENTYESVLVFINASNAKEIHMAYIKPDNKWTVESGNGNHSTFITHWRPLPEAPKTD